MKKSNSRTKNKESPGRVRFILMNLMRFILVISFLLALYSSRWLVFIIALLGLTVTFIPFIVHKLFNVKIPAAYEVIMIFFIYGFLFLSDVRGLFGGFWMWSALLNSFSAVALGFVGLAVIYALHKEQKINANPFIIAVFSFTFAVAIGAVWEIFEFSLDTVFGFQLQKSALDTMTDLLINSGGALVISVAGYYYIKQGKFNVVSTMITKFIERNPKMFKTTQSFEDQQQSLLDLIKDGENKDLEFKSTLRTNLHTNQHDRKIEHATLKTLCGYLNTDGGTLLVGVSDNGTVVGTQADNFQNKDKLNLHFTNLLKNHIGSEYLPFISFDLISVGKKEVLKVQCRKSNKYVFLKMDGSEEFFVRNGPSTVGLKGSALVDFINHNF